MPKVYWQIRFNASDMNADKRLGRRHAILQSIFNVYVERQLSIHKFFDWL
jgi:hypothetical protein